MENIKKLLICFVISMFIVPQISLAAWWNPLTWKIFNIRRNNSVYQKTEGQILKNQNEKLKKNDDPKDFVEKKFLQNKIVAITTTTLNAENKPVKKVLEQQIIVENREIEIAKCKAKADLSFSIFVAKVEALIVQQVEKIKANTKTLISESHEYYGGESMPDGLSPDQRSSIFEQRQQLRDRYILTIKEKESDQIDSLYDQKNKFILEGKDVSNKEYQECLNSVR